MNEYINKDKILSMSYCINKPTWDNPYLDPKSVVDVDDIESLPAADVAEVVHGEWIEYQTPNIICCSECDWGTGVDEKTFKFCPNCGAKMDGKRWVI